MIHCEKKEWSYHRENQKYIKHGGDITYIEIKQNSFISSLGLTF